MRELQVVIERVSRVSDQLQRLHLSADEYLDTAKPGQTLLARPVFEPHPEQWNPYLREQWWPVSLTTQGLVVERPAQLSYEPGDLYSVIGLVGKPYLYKRMLRHVLLLADDTAPTPLVMSCEWLVANKVSVTVVLSGKAKAYPVKSLPQEAEVILADDDLSWPNRVMTVGWADQVFAVVAQDDEVGRFQKIHNLFHELRAELPKAYLFGVYQMPQPCGIGACQACLVNQQGSEPSLICVDGPALDLTTVKF